MRYYRIPDETIKRLPAYLQGLCILKKQDYKCLSSKELAELLITSPNQIRKDFSYFGTLGKRGVGYEIEHLVKQIKKILYLDVNHKTAIIGAGNLGKAILAYPGFDVFGFEIAAAFDNDPKKIGKKINNIIIEDIEDIYKLRQRKISIGILTVPRQASQQVTDKLIDAGITGILNFSPCRVTVPKKVKVISINICI